MNKKGFTLIELLAVIVILAIIATIATPVVLNIINDAKGEAELRSEDFYLDAVELSIAKAALENRNIEDGTYNVLENGNICLSYEDDDETTCKDELKVEVKGQAPKSGSISIKDGKIDDTTLSMTIEMLGKK